MSGPIDLANPALHAFWAERHLCTLTTLRKDGSPHVVAVGATLEGGLCRVPGTLQDRLAQCGTGRECGERGGRLRQLS